MSLMSEEEKREAFRQSSKESQERLGRRRGRAGQGRSQPGADRRQGPAPPARAAIAAKAKGKGKGKGKGGGGGAMLQEVPEISAPRSVPS